jgi:hypothetical protein
MGACQVQGVAQKIHQKRARINIGCAGLSVHGN